MKKIPTIFKRNPDNMSELLNEPHPDCQWVFDGEGVATQKYDGTCVMIKDGMYYKRREVKEWQNEPGGFVQEDFDENTGKRFGWILVDRDEKENRWHMEAYEDYLGFDAYEIQGRKIFDGTYELVGEKINNNPEKINGHILIDHAQADKFPDAPRSFGGLASWLADKDIEGLVWHHPDGRMAKIKKRDFAMKR